MPSLTPYIGRSVDRLVNLLNTDNGRNYQIGVDFEITGAPVVANGPDGRNTKILVTPLPESGYTDAQEVFYWRLGIDALARLPNGSVDAIPRPPLPFTTYDVLDQLNTALGLNLLPSEVVNLTYTAEATSYALTIKAGTSYAWVPSTYMFKVTADDITYDLGESITGAGPLAGFSYVRPPSP